MTGYSTPLNWIDLELFPPVTLPQNSFLSHFYFMGYISEPKVGIEPTFPLYESGVLPLNYLGMEPLTGIEPVTSSFVYTSPYGRTRLYLSP